MWQLSNEQLKQVSSISYFNLSCAKEYNKDVNVYKTLDLCTVELS